MTTEQRRAPYKSAAAVMLAGAAMSGEKRPDIGENRKGDL